jgi:hypothetical protein
MASSCATFERPFYIGLALFVVVAGAVAAFVVFYFQPLGPVAPTPAPTLPGNALSGTMTCPTGNTVQLYIQSTRETVQVVCTGQTVVTFISFPGMDLFTDLTLADPRNKTNLFLFRKNF